MRILLLSDIHSNLEALKAVLDAAPPHDLVWNLGDVVGYGANPNEVIDRVRGLGSIFVRGNHDKACCGIGGIEAFNPIAARAAQWTHDSLTPENLEWLRQLPAGPVRPEGSDASCSHGSPLDEDEYLMTASDVRNIFEYLEAKVSFFGHTHLQCAYGRANGAFQMFGRLEGPREEVWSRLDPNGVYLINAGSVGQPRDGDPRAAYALFDSESLELVQRRVRYDYQTTQLKIVAAGLPDILGARLAVGR